MWNKIVQYNIDWETRQKAYINLALRLLVIQLRGGWKNKKNKEGEAGIEFWTPVTQT